MNMTNAKRISLGLKNLFIQTWYNGYKTEIHTQLGANCHFSINRIFHNGYGSELKIGKLRISICYSGKFSHWSKAKYLSITYKTKTLVQW